MFGIKKKKNSKLLIKEECHVPVLPNEEEHSTGECCTEVAKIEDDEKRLSARIDWGKLQEYIDDDDITDIKCNSKTVWVKHVSKGTWRADFNLDSNELQKIANQVSNCEGVPINRRTPILPADYSDLRIHIVDGYACPSGINITIRKTPFLQRIVADLVEENKYCTLLCMDFIKEAVKKKLGIVNGGETGAGKTEGAKVECSFIPEEQGIITIEDTSELHISTLYPLRNIIEMKTYEFMDFETANKSTLRMDPDWVLLSEARDKSISKLIQCRSEGHGILTTLHLKSSTGLVARIINMYGQDDRPTDEQIENMVYEYFDICIHMTCDIDSNHTHRFIDEISIYDRINKKNILTTIYRADKNFNVTYEKLPETFAKQLDPKIVKRWNDSVR